MIKSPDIKVNPDVLKTLRERLRLWRGRSNQFLVY